MSAPLHNTPRSRLVWWNLAGWVEVAHVLEKRRCSSRKNAQKIFHVQALPEEFIWKEDSSDTLRRALELLTGGPSGFRQPCRGQRQEAPHTALISAIKNRIKQIERQRDRDSMPDGHNSIQMIGSR